MSRCPTCGTAPGERPYCDDCPVWLSEALASAEKERGARAALEEDDR